MKLSNVLVIATVTAALVSFQYGKKEKLNDVVVYNLDKSGSTLGWKAGKSANYFHSGVVDFGEGSLTMDKGNVTNGTFTVDLSSIKVSDAELPKEKKEYLITLHLLIIMIL